VLPQGHYRIPSKDVPDFIGTENMSDLLLSSVADEDELSFLRDPDHAHKELGVPMEEDDVETVRESSFLDFNLTPSVGGITRLRSNSSGLTRQTSHR
jgi:hypothetical protein